MRDRARFLAAFVRRPFDTGSITPSSIHLAGAMVAGMDLHAASTVVELGPGTGVFTKLIEAQLKPGACCLCFEIHCEMAKDLARQFPRVQVVNDSVEHIDRYLKDAGRTEVDAAISGLPWAAFTPDHQKRLLDATVGALRPGGRFATFAYTHAARMPRARKFRELLESRFTTVTTSPIVWRNVPPAFVYRCQK